MTAKAPTLENLIDLYGVPDPKVVGKLPRVTCAKCRDRKENPGGVCSQHAKVDCTKEKQPNRKDGWCGNWMTERHMHIDYVGHAELTRQLAEIDADWKWEPMGFAPDGTPAIVHTGNESNLWGRLTLLGKTLPGVGTCEKGKHDELKELVGDFLRNAAMRFGLNLSLWSKQEWEDTVDETPEPTSPPQDRIATTRERPSESQSTRQVVEEATDRFAPLSDEAAAAAAELVDPDLNPSIALKDKYKNTVGALKAGRDYCATHGIDPAPSSFKNLVEDFPQVVTALLHG